MTTKNQELTIDEIYHIILRGVGDSLIFKDKNDYYRAIFSLYEFNDDNPVSIREKRKLRKKSKNVKGLTFDILNKKRDVLIELLAFCLMPNHIHLLVRQVKDNGITKFMRKFGTGQAMYFNKKYQRKGHLFATFRAVHIKDDEQLKNVFVYIHANPISLIEPNWKENGIANPENTSKFLENYKWSSYLDYIGKKNFPSLTKRDFISEIMNGEQGCKEFVDSWIKYKGEIKDFNNIALE